jgi:ABC-type thiamine transport system ATPase subunit
MPTTPGHLDRVLSALEDFASQEELLVGAEDYAAVADVQVRMAPLIHFLVEEVAAADTAVRQRIASLVSRRDRTGQRLAAEVGKVEDDMVQLELSRRRIARVAPAYGLRNDAVAAPRLSARS